MTELATALQAHDVEFVPTSEVTPMSDERKDLTASLAAAAQMDTSNPDRIGAFEQAREITLSTITNEGEMQLRRSIAAQQLATDVAEFDGIMEGILSNQDRSDAEEKLLKSYATVRETMMAMEQHDALEAVALTKIAALAIEHPEHAEVAEQLLKHKEMGDAADWVRDQLERTLIIQREAMRVGEEFGDSNFLSKAANYMALLIPTNVISAANQIGDAEFWALSGTNIRNVGHDLMTMPREQFDKEYPEVFENIREHSGFISSNPVIMQTILGGFINMSEAEAANQNLFDVVDVAALIPFSKATQLTKMAILKSTSRPTAADSVEAALDAGRVGGPSNVPPVGSTDEALDASMPSTYTMPDGTGAPSIGEAALRAIQTNKEVITDLKRMLQENPGRLTQAEIDEAVANTKRKVLDRFGKAAVVDFLTPQVVKAGVPFRNGVGRLTFLIGRKDGHGFASESSAKAAATRQGIGDAKFTYDNKSGTWFIRGEMDVAEKNFVSLDHTQVTDGTTLGAWVRSSASIMPKMMQDMAARADFSASQLHRMLQPITKNISGLNKKSRQAIEAVWVRGRDIDEKWYSPVEFQAQFRQLNGRAATDKELLAYQSMRDLNNFEYYLRNHAQYIQRASEGYMTGSLKASDFELAPTNVKRIESTQDMRQSTVYDVDRGEIVAGSDIRPSELQSKLDSGKYELYLIQNKNLRVEGTPVQYIYARKGVMQTKPLQYRQLKYKAGGHRIYEGTVFVKQAMVGTVKNRAGQAMRYIQNPKTHGVFPTRGSAQEYATRMESARLAYVGHKAGQLSREEANDIIKRAGFEDGLDEVQGAINDGRLIEDQVFEVIRDKEVPKVYATIMADDHIDMRVIDDGFPHWLEDQGRLYYSQRGAALKGPQDQLAQTIDPFATANRAVENAMQQASYINYKVNAVQRWLNTFGHLLPQGERMSDLQRFWHSPIIEKGDNAVVRAAERSRRALMNQIGHPTKFGRDLQEGIVRMADWVEDKVPGRVGTSTAKGLLDIQSKDPIAAIKGLSFDAKLGLFDPSQLIVQTQTAFAIATVDPLNAPKFFRDAFSMRWALVNRNESILAAAAKMSSMEPKEFSAMVQSLRKTGAADPAGELVLLDQHPGIAASTLGSGVAKVRDKGRVLFYEAERLNRVYAWRKAWNDLRNDGWDVARLQSEEGLQRLSGMTDQYTMNMISSSAAAWQKGLLSVPTQFLSYQARFLENVLPKQFGGNPQWSASQKMRLALGQMFLYGSLGVPAGRAMLEQARDWGLLPESDGGMVDETVQRAMLGGMFDSLIYAATLGEVDVAFGTRAAVMGKGFEDLIENLMGGGPGDNGFLHVAAGAPFSVAFDFGSDFLNGAMDIFHAAASEQAYVTDVTPEVLADIADNISVFSRAQRAYWVLRYGEWISQESGKTLTKATPMEAVSAALGIQPRDLAEIDYMRGMIDNDKEFVRDMAKRVRQLQLEGFRALRNGDRQTFERKRRVIIGVMQVLDPRERMAVSRAGSQLPDKRDLYEEMQGHAMRNFGIEPLKNMPKRNTNEE